MGQGVWKIHLIFWPVGAGHVYVHHHHIAFVAKEIGRQFQPEHMSLNLGNVLQGNHLPYQGRNPTEAAKKKRRVLAYYFRNERTVSGQLGIL